MQPSSAPTAPAAGAGTAAGAGAAAAGATAPGLVPAPVAGAAVPAAVYPTGCELLYNNTILPRLHCISNKNDFEYQRCILGWSIPGHALPDYASLQVLMLGSS